MGSSSFAIASRSQSSFHLGQKQRVRDHTFRSRPPSVSFAYTTLLIFVLSLLTPALAGFVSFQNCLPTTITSSNPRQLQFTPHFVWASIGDSPDRQLNVTVYGNVSGISVDPSKGETLPPPGDPAWKDDGQTAGKIVNVDGNYTTLFTKYNMLGYIIHVAKPEPFCSAMVNGDCPISPVFESNHSDPSILPAFSVSQRLGSSYAFSSIVPHIRVLSGDPSHTLLTCVTADIVPDLGSKVANVLTWFPAVILIIVAFSNLVAATASPWGSSDPFHFTSNYGRDEDLIRLITPTFSDCLQYIQFVVLAGSLSLNYPGFYQPAVSHGSWSVLLFNQSFVSDDAGRPTLLDGVYNVQPDSSSKGLDTMAQLCGLSSGKDVWTGFVIWLLVIIGAAILISQLSIGLRWISLYVSGDRDHNMRPLNIPFTVGNILRVILNFFLLPAFAFSLFQLVKTKSSPATPVVFAVILLIILIGGSGYIMFLITRTRPQSYLFDDLPTVLLFGPLYNTYADDPASFFSVLMTILTFVKGIAIGAVQASGIAQLVLLAISEVALVIMILAFRPYQHATHMNLYHTIFALIRFLTVILSVTFIPALNVSNAVRGWVGYVILALHAVILIFGFLLNAIQTLVEVFLRLCGAGGDGADPTRGGLVNVLGMRQLSRRTVHAPHHSINSAAEVLVRPSGQFDPDESRRSRSLSAGSTLLLGRSGGIPSGAGVEGYDPTESHSRTNSVGAGRAMTPSTTSAILQGGASPASTLPNALGTPASQRAMGLAALRARDNQGGPFYRPPRTGPVRTWTRRRGGGGNLSGPEATGDDVFAADDSLQRAAASSGYQAAAHDDPDSAPYADDAIASVAGQSGPPAKDYAIREADFYYRVRGPALSAKPTRKLKTGPGNPIETNNGGMAGWFKGLFGGGKTKDKGKGFEVVRSHRALDVEEGDLGDETGKGESINMSTRPHSLPEEEDEIHSVHEDESMVNSKDELTPQSPYSLQTTDLFPEPYHDEPSDSGKGRLQRNFSRSEAGSVRSNVARQTSAANRPRGSVLHEADEESSSQTGSDNQKPSPLPEASLANAEQSVNCEEQPRSQSPLPVLPAVESVDAIKLPSRFNSTNSTGSNSQYFDSLPPIFAPPSRPPPSERLPPLPAPPSHALHRASASQLTRNTSQLSRAPTIPRRSSKRNSSVPILGTSFNALPSAPMSAQTRTSNQISVSEGRGRDFPQRLSTGQMKMSSTSPANPDLLSDNSEQTRFPFLGTPSIDRSKSTSDRSEDGLTTDSMGSSTAGPLKHFATAAAAAAAAAESQESEDHPPEPTESRLPRQGPSLLEAAYSDDNPNAEAEYRGAGIESLYPRPLSQATSSRPSSTSVNPLTSSLRTSNASHRPSRPFSTSPASSSTRNTEDPYSYLNQVTEHNHGEVLHHRTGDGLVLGHSHDESVDLSGSRAEVVSPSDVSTRTQTTSDQLER